MPSYAIYTRQSRVRHDITLSSCDVQLQICRDFAEAVLPQGSVWCGTRYDDPGQSGETLDRPALQALRKEVEAEAVSHLIVYRLDRLFRRLRDTVCILDTLRRHGVELKIVTAHGLGQSATGQLMPNLLASFAEFEHGLISERIRESICARRRGGRRLSGKPPLGYDLDKHTRGLVVNAIESRRVRAFFRLAAAGQTPRQIAEYANARGWTTKVYLARNTGNRLGGGPWAACQILELLRYVHYRCRSHAGGRPPCKGVAVPAEQLRSFILDTMRDEKGLEAGPDLTPETRQALQAAVHLIDQLRVPDPYTAVDDIIDRIVFGRESIRIAFSEPGLRQLLSAPPCEPRTPLTGRERDVPSEPGR